MVLFSFNKDQSAAEDMGEIKKNITRQHTETFIYLFFITKEQKMNHCAPN